MKPAAPGKFRSLAIYFFAAVFFQLTSCTWEKAEPDYHSYPTEIGKIVVNRCATSGCHNTESSAASGGLDLSSWAALFKGSDNNSSVIPYRSDLSFLAYSVNMYPELGPEMCPSMPLNGLPLSRAEVQTIKSWIDVGAPDYNGYVKWSENPARRKIYVVNQGCDFITVFDADSKLIMRAIDVGITNGTEAPHDLMLSPDGNYFFLSFYANSIIQKYRTSDGVKVGQIDLGVMGWHAMAASGNGQFALCTHFTSDGKVALLDLESMTLIYNYQGSGLFSFPHGCAFNYNGTLAYITSLEGNFVYKINLTDQSDPLIEQIPLQPGETPVPIGIHKPYEVDFCPDYSKYYVTCQGTNEVRVFKTANDSLLKTIPTSGVPQLITFSKTRPYAFVTCTEDSASVSTHSSVNIINTGTDDVIATVATGYQPRGIAVDDANDCVWVANRNVSGLGVAPHHTTACAGRNGYVTIIDMKTLQLIPGWKTEVSVDPYCVAIRP